MNTEQFNSIVSDTLSKCQDTLCKKAKEYATADRLHNFNIAAGLENTTPIGALAGMMAKHTVSVYDLIQRHEKDETIPMELWREKIGDHINYLLLLTAVIEGEQAVRDCGKEVEA